MSAMRFTKSHEREEGRLLRRGFAHSCTGLALCWLPVVGLLFAASGFLRVMVRLTRRHRKTRKAYLVFSFLSLAVCTGVLLGEIWIYSRDPEILNRTAQQAWTFIVGEENADALDQSEPDGVVYDDMNGAGLGVSDDFWLDEGVWSDEDWTEEDWAALEEDFDWGAWEDEEWGLEEDGFAESDVWEDDFWSDEEWSDEVLTAEDSLTAAEDDLSALSVEEMDWLADESATILGESSEQAGASANIGRGETILPPLE